MAFTFGGSLRGRNQRPDAPAPTPEEAAPPEATGEPGTLDAAREAEIRRVYDNYIASRKAAGAPGDGPSYEKWREISLGSEGIKNWEREWELDKTADILGEGGYDPEVAQNYEHAAAAKIDPAFYGASKSLAADYSRRGLGDSGMSAGAQQDAASQWAVQRALSSERAIERAKGDRRTALMDEAGLDINLLNYGLQKDNLALQQQALDEANNQDGWDQIMQLAGLGVGLVSGRPPAMPQAAAAPMSAPTVGGGFPGTGQLQFNVITGQYEWV